jgi:hypothetical protein
MLEKDSTIGAVIHIDPDDSPIVGQPATIYIDIKDTAGKLDLQKCTCQVSISKDNKELFIHDITPTLMYAFPEKGNYELSISGTPKDNAAFTSFDIDYDVAVSRIASDQQSKGFLLEAHILHILIFGIGFAITIFVIIRDIRREKKL